MNTPTPETDTFQNAFKEDANTEQNFITLQHYCDLTEFARKLERERDMWKAEAKKWETIYDELQDPLLFEVRRDSFGETEKYPDCLRRVIAERDQLRKVCDELVAAWVAYRVFPSFANEKLFAAAICLRNHLPHVKK